jgi:2-polyprenyl-6-methoxyphenol hydroxylase-like FAD-dependent oxidoreductase
MERSSPARAPYRTADERTTIETTMADTLTTQVAVVGGGPVGLFLGCSLALQGVECLVLERRSRPQPHPRAIGIHPVGLRLFEHLGIAQRLIAEDVAVRRGRELSGSGRLLGTITFDRLPKPYPFVLSLAQPVTESILEELLQQLAPHALRREVDVHEVRLDADGATLACTRSNGRDLHASSDYVVGCDGKSSTVRDTMGVRFRGGRYPDQYLMGDLESTTDLDADAAIYLHRDGVVESLPISGGLRRWVCRVPRRVAETDHRRDALDRCVAARTGRDVSTAEAHWLTAFTAERYIADRLVSGRAVLAGDAAHITSPIGGQGLNLGWRDAWSLAVALRQAMDTGASAPLLEYERVSRASATPAIRRAGAYMWLGRPRHWPRPRDLALCLILRSPFAGHLARLFAMGGLPSLPAG